MQNDDDDPIPLTECTLPGTIIVTPRALDLAERFAALLPSQYLAAFYWYDGMSTKSNKDAPWVDSGPGVDLGGYRVSQIPVEAIYQHGTFRYIVAIRQEVVEQHPERTIDLDDHDKVVFR